MKRNDLLKELRHLSVEKLTGKIQESKKRLVELDQEKLLGKLKNVSSHKYLRRQIAQMLTVRDEKIATKVEKNA
jgi:ribosomal protein L29